MTAGSYEAVYRDTQGEIHTTLANDRKTLKMRLGAVEFAGDDLDAFEAVGQPGQDALSRFTLDANGSLCAFSLDFAIPVLILAGAGEERGQLGVHLEVGRPRPAPRGGVLDETLRLELAVGGRSFSSRGASGWFEDELLDIQRALPDGWRLKMCFGCAFSDYSPAGHGLFGGLACFRGNKTAYLAVKSKADFWPVLKTMTERVQETHLCPEFEVRKPGTGYRG
jgi:hypothetical protein